MTDDSGGPGTLAHDFCPLEYRGERKVNQMEPCKTLKDRRRTTLMRVKFVTRLFNQALCSQAPSLGFFDTLASDLIIDAS